MTSQQDPTRAVLLVEDDLAQRKLVGFWLKRNGWRDVCATTGKEALEVVEREGDSIEILLLDVMLPDTDGWTLSQEILARLPKLKVLYISTHELTRLKSLRGWPIPEDLFLRKPFSEAELAEKLTALHG